MTVKTGSSEQRARLALDRSGDPVLGLPEIILDSTIVNVALPSIQHDLHFSQSNLAWVMNAYLIAFGGLLLLAASGAGLDTRRRPERRPRDAAAPRSEAGRVHTGEDERALRVSASASRR